MGIPESRSWFVNDQSHNDHGEDSARGMQPWISKKIQNIILRKKLN